MPEITLSVGAIEYQDSGGSGSPIVFLHGFLMDPSMWDAVIRELRGAYRCLAPTLPLGAHRRALPDADLSLTGIARLVIEFLQRLDLQDVTLVGNDTGGALTQLVIAEQPPQVARAVLASCEAFDNMPPGLPGRTLALAAKLPPRAFGAFMQQLRLRPVRRLPLAFGWLTKYGDATTAGWIQPVLTQPEIRADAVRAVRAASDHSVMEEAAQRLGGFERPVLVVWAKQDKVMPPEHGRRLVEALPNARLEEVDDSYTLIALDQPQTLARLIADFAGTSVSRSKH